MDRQKVALEKRDGQYVEIGVVVGTEGKVRRIRGLDGAQFERRGAEVLTPLAGSFIHLLRAHPTALAELMSSEPVAVAKQVVADAPEGLTPREVRERLSEIPDIGDLEGIWPRLERALRDDDEIQSKGRPARLRLNKNVSWSLLPLLPSGVSPLANHNLNKRETPRPQTRPESAQHQGEQQEDVASLLEVLADIEVDPAVRQDMANIRRNILPIALALKAAQRSVLAKSAPTLRGRERTLAEVIVAAAGGKVVLDFDHALPALPESLAVEVAAQATSLRKPEAERAATTVLEAVAGVPEHAFSPGQVIELLRTTARWRKPLPSQVTDRLLDSYAEWLMSKGSTPNGEDLRVLSRAVRTAPSGSRSAPRLVGTLADLAPDLLADEMWWPVDFQELVEVASGPLGRVLDMEPVATRIAAARVTAQVTTAETRSQVFRALGAPSCLARHVRTDQLEAAWRRAAAIDSLAAEWLDSLRDRAEVEALRADRDDALGAKKRAVERAQGLEGQLADAQDRIETLARQLSAAVESAASEADAQLLQARMETLRAMARLAVSAVEAAVSHDDRALQQKVSFQVGREGLEMVGEIGATEAFDPARHDSLGVVIETKAMTTVTRPGYDYVSTTGERLVLIKPQVVQT